jgi:hypothetical protein
MTIRAMIGAAVLASALSMWIAAPGYAQGDSRVVSPAGSAIGSICDNEKERDFIRVFQPIEAISYVLGSKRVVGYFTRVNRECRVTLMVVEEVDPMQGDPHSAARLIVSLRPEQSVSVGSMEAETMLVTCKSLADSVEVQRSSSRDHRVQQVSSQVE